MTTILLLSALFILAHPQRNEAQTAPAAVVDVAMTPSAGSALVDFIGTALGRAQDTILPPRLFEERTAWRRSAGMTYRFAKLFTLDLPLEDWLRVANHEVFGHGARLRERFDGPIRYRVGVPPPYGGGGGSTSFGFDRQPTIEELLLITVGGMEANNVGASRVALRAVAQGAAPYRDMLRYLLLRLDTVAYILDTGDEPEDEGHDVSDFLITLREEAGSNLTARDLRRRAIVGLADPMVGFAVYGLAVSYLWRGDREAPVPAFHVGQVRYLPALRLQLTPFGTEWVFENTFAVRGPDCEDAMREPERQVGRQHSQATRVSVRVGEAPGAASFGASVHREAVWTWRRARIDADVHAWRQPRILDGGSVERSTGAGAFATASVPLDVKWLRWAAVVVQAGYKSRGFIEGEPLGSGFVLRGGVGLLH
jgi:hypothetical protein